MSSRKYSKELVDGPNQAASRSMLRGVGFTSEDFTKPFVGIASTGAKVTPCNMHINQLSELVEGSINASGGKIRVGLTTSETASLKPGRFMYDVLITDAQGEVTRVLEGSVLVREGVTR